MRKLAIGHPVRREQADQIITDLGIGRDEAYPFLREVTERDADDNIVGIMGLSLNEHPHRLRVDGKSLSAWCAEDTLFLPTLLKRTAIVESYAPVTREKIRLTVSPERVEDVRPAGAVIEECRIAGLDTSAIAVILGRMSKELDDSIRPELWERVERMVADRTAIRLQ